MRLATPSALDGVSLVVNGRPIPIADELRSQPPTNIWQLPLPAGFIKTQKAFSMTLTAPGREVVDVALLGDPISDRFLARFAGRDVGSAENR